MQQIMRIDAEKKSREQNDLKNHFVTAPLFYKWRKGWDSNPRYAINVHSISNAAPSTPRPPLRKTYTLYHDFYHLSIIN